MQVMLSGIGRGAGIDGVAEDMVDCRVACLDPSNIAALAHLQRKGETLFAEPQPDPAYRPRLGESVKDIADGSHDCLYMRGWRGYYGFCETSSGAALPHPLGSVAASGRSVAVVENIQPSPHGADEIGGVPEIGGQHRWQR